MSLFRSAARVPLNAARMAAIRPAQSRSVITVAKDIYTCEAVATGGGRADGKVELLNTTNKIKSVATEPPKEMGGKGEEFNPEQLVSMGYSACFLGALRLTAKNQGKTLGSDVKVNVSMTLGEDAAGGFGVKASIEVSGDGVTQKLVEDTMTVCPYSKVFEKGLDTKVAYVK